MGPRLGKRGARVFARDRIHVTAVLIRPDFDDPPLCRGHPLGVREIDNGETDLFVPAHVDSVELRIARADQDVVALEPSPPPSYAVPVFP
jgi:hypothetical protein